MYPATDNLLPMAQVLKSYGTEGEIIANFRSEVLEDINIKEPIFLIFDGLSVPFFINSIEAKGSKRAKIKFEDIDSLDEAEEIVGRTLFIEDKKKSVKAKVDSTLYIEDLIGYELYGQEDNHIGTIKNVFDFSGNICLSIENDKLVPFHEEIVIKIEKKKKKITLAIDEAI